MNGVIDDKKPTGWLDKHLVPGWRQSWRWWSNQALLLAGTISTVVVAAPDLLVQFTALLGGTAPTQATVIAVIVLIWLLRTWNQGSNDGQ